MDKRETWIDELVKKGINKTKKKANTDMLCVKRKMEGDFQCQSFFIQVKWNFFYLMLTHTNATCNIKTSEVKLKNKEEERKKK